MDAALPVIYRAVEYIESRLREEIAVAEMAAAAGYSLFHFVRSFNRIVQHTPYEYLIRRRLSELACELVRTDKKIIDLAVEYGFHSSEVFSRAFKRMFGIQPSEYRSRGVIDPRFILSHRTMAYLQHINQEDFRPPFKVEWQPLNLAGLMARIQGDPHEMSSLWTTLRQEISALQDLGERPRFYGVTAYPAGWETHGPFFLAAVAVTSLEEVRPPLASQILPSGPYACFIHPGAAESISLTRDYIYQTWLPKSGRRLAYPVEVQSFGQEMPSYDEPSGSGRTGWRAIHLPLRSP